ncbi:hypothetical protein [Amycolatopsis suaedae]|uniref:Uncharacterized protein n=1 Tax=Amycolatopsis suaedae TaxID=2510978 RepID=A0A4Q7J605_9PSEU|nr:hypothetical protein [Amycolatopsis suaedae]RZQ62308.1 hypothetical protein EWH70_18700 [Amycolatopsis suaedae]
MVTRWIGPAAAGWSALYVVLGMLWTLGVPGFPFGEGDPTGPGRTSVLSGLTLEAGPPAVAAVGLGGLVLALVRRGRLVAALCWVYAVALAVVIPEGRVLVWVAYLPVFLVGAPFGYPPVSFTETVLTWLNLNQVLLIAGGLLFAGLALRTQRAARDACVRCGRPARAWTEQAARWGRWAAWVAFAVPLAYAVVRWAWVFHIPLAYTEEGVRELHANGLATAGAGLATFALVGGVLTLGLARSWSERLGRWRIPRWLPLGLAGTVTALLLSLSSSLVRGWVGGSLRFDVGDILTWVPLWALALGAATLGFYYRTRGACGRCGSPGDGAESGRRHGVCESR